MAQEKIAIRVLDETPLNPAELAEFLYLFRAVNRALRQLGADPAAKDELVQEYREALAHLPPEQLDALFVSQSDPADFAIAEISRKSPLELVLAASLAAALVLPAGASILALSLRVALGGGKVKLQATTKAASASLEAEIPSLGEAIDGVKKALALGKNVEAAFGVRGRHVKLNDAEFTELMKPINGNGGWEDFFLRLQLGVNKQTKELSLTEEDVARIYKYKDQPEAGGFQGRINKVFIRHFPDTRTIKALPKPK